MSHQVFRKVGLAAWVCGTIERHSQGAEWRLAWIETCREIGGAPRSGDEKPCPMVAARNLYECGRLENCGMPFKECELAELWGRSRNGTYAILATMLLRTDPGLSKSALWREIQRAVRREVGEEPAVSDQCAPTLTFQLWHLGLIRQR